MKLTHTLLFIFIINLTVGQITKSPNGTKDPLLLGTELYFETSYKTMYQYITKEMGFKYIGSKEQEGLYIFEFDNNKNDENWNNLTIVFMDKELTKQYIQTYSLFKPYLADEYRKALLASGYNCIRENESEKFITENYIYEFKKSYVLNRKVYSLWIARKLNESDSNQVRSYEEHETTFDYKESMTYSKSDGKPLTGIVYKKYNNGKLDFERSYKDGKRNGKSTYWYIGGELKMSEENWINGKQDGKQLEWNLDGRLWKEQNYKNGVQEGLQKTWYHSGVLSSETFYSNDEILYRKCWDKNGNLIKCD